MTMLKIAVICVMLSVAECLFTNCATAQDLVIHYDAEQVAIPKSVERELREIINNDDYFTIEVNQYDEKYCLPRKYSLLRALELRKFMMKKGVRLEKIKIIVTTDRHKENNVATIDVHKIT